MLMQTRSKPCKNTLSDHLTVNDLKGNWGDIWCHDKHLLQKIERKKKDKKHLAPHSFGIYCVYYPNTDYVKLKVNPSLGTLQSL